MIIAGPSDGKRTPKTLNLTADLVVVGGGLAGTCAAITAARAGIRVLLVQDRPVLGGNASSEVRLWILGATSHMGNNNRWAREGGVVDEILVENLYRNPEGNPLILDTILLEKVVAEQGITLLLNTSVFDLDMDGAEAITEAHAFCSQNSTRYVIHAPLFCDASGDGILGFLAGAAFRMGAESRREFGEGLAPDAAYGELLGHTLYFYSKDTGRPVVFTAPSYALKDITEIPRFRDVRSNEHGCHFWWFEYGGRMDTVCDTELIKWELWKVAYGVWNYIKNSGNFPAAETLALEWVGTIPGKRESRRFEGDVILSQQDLVGQRVWDDAVSVGGWAIDLHPADGVYSPLPSCTQWHSKGVYQVPYRCMYSRNVRNLFLAGRIISVSHVAFGSTRVMATCAHNAQAVGVAAAFCVMENLLPKDLVQPDRIRVLQRELLKTGQYIPGVALHDPKDLAGLADVTSSSRLVLDRLEPDGTTQVLDVSRAMLLPVVAGLVPAVTLLLDVSERVQLDVELRTSSKRGNFTPDVMLACQSYPLQPGTAQALRVAFDKTLLESQYIFLCLTQNPVVSVHLSGQRITGVLSVARTMNAAVAKGVRQEPPEGSGIDSFEFWLPSRRPGGKSFAVMIDPPLDVFPPENVKNGVSRPTVQPNAWVAGRFDPTPRLTLRWPEPRSIVRIDLGFDTDLDHPMESVLRGHPEREIPFCVKCYQLLDAAGCVIYKVDDNHQTRNRIRFAKPICTDALQLEILETRYAPAAVFEIRCYEQE